MSTLSLLPLVRLTDGVQTTEDWQVSLAFYLEDGVTPIPLDGLSFTLAVGGLATLTSLAGQIAIAGPSDNVLLVYAPAAQVTGWAIGLYPLTLVASDGVATRDIFASSTLAVGSPQVARVTLLVAPDATASAVVSALPAAFAAAFQALQPEAIADAIASLSAPQLQTLAQALFAALPVQTGATAPAASGQAFVNSSGYVVLAP